MAVLLPHACANAQLTYLKWSTAQVPIKYVVFVGNEYDVEINVLMVIG
jgi:hypothetical protein